MRFPYTHRTRPRWRGLGWLLALTMLAAALPARAAGAQTQFTTPRVRIAPAGGEFAAGAQVVASVQYCSRYPFHAGSESMDLRGQPVSFAGTTLHYGTQSDCPSNHHQFERRNIVLPLTHGANLFRARIENNPDGLPNNPNGYYRQSSVTYGTPWPNYGLTIVAADRYGTARAGQSRVARFRLANTGDVSTTYTPTCSWTGGTCSLAPVSVTLDPGDTASVAVTVALGAAGSVGTVAFSAAGGAGPLPATARAVTELRAVAPPPTARGVSLVNPSGIVERDLCVTVRAGNDGAMECGDLRLAHALPSIRTLGKARTPVLLYNSALADPLVVIPADVALGGGTAAGTTISATVVLTWPAAVNGTTFAAGQWLASDWPASGEAQRIAAGFDASALPTGAYGYRLEIRRSTDAVVDLAHGTLLHVNRATSPLHAGWWLAGLEQSVRVGTSDSLLWVGGDGSRRLYVPTAACEWHAEQVDRPDRMVCGSAGGLRRLLPNGLEVHFDAAGRHRYTVNRLGDTTEFVYDAQGRPASIVVPPRTNGTGVASYTLHYGASGLLDSVSAPPLDAATPRRVKLTWVTGRPMIGGAGGGRILTLTDPDTSVVQLHYANATAGQGEYRVTGRSDRRSTLTTFAYGPGAKLASASTPASAAQAVAQAFRPAEGLGVGAASPVAGRAVALDSVFTQLDGPRTDVADITRWWTNRLGAPLRVRDPMGVETRIVHDATWPGLAAVTIGPSGLRTEAHYNARGLVDSVRAFAPYGGSDVAVTRYYWHATWDMPDSVRTPTGERTSRAYDAHGNVLWEQAGTNAARRVTFTWDPATRQLVAARQPGIATADTIAYDPVRRNVARTTSPAGRWTRHVTDALGRDTLVETSIDATRHATQRIRYDIVDQVRETRSIGPAMPYALVGTANDQGQRDTAAVLPETLVVRTAYDREGNVVRLQKLSLPDPRPWVNLCDAPTGQCQGIVAEDSGSIDIRTYDWVHRLRTQRLGTSGGTYTYDPAGNVLTHQGWHNMAVTHRHDAAGRRTMTIVPQKSYSPEACENVHPGPYRRTAQSCAVRFPIYPSNANAELVIAADTSRFVFDQAGAMVGAHNRHARVDRSWHPAGALATDTMRLRDYVGASFTLRYGLAPVYDLSGRRVRLRTPWAADSIRYAYDPDHGALATVWQGSARLRFTYDLAGRQDSLLIGTGTATGVTETRGYDADGQLVRRVRTSAVLGNLVTDSLARDLRDKVLDVHTLSAAIDVGMLSYHNRYSGLGAVLAQQKLRQAHNWDLEEFRASALGDVYRSRTFHSAGGNRFPTTSTYNHLGALVSRGPERDWQLTGVANYSDTTHAMVDRAGNVEWTQTYSREYPTGGTENQSVVRSYYGADHKLRFQQRYEITVAPGATGILPQSGSWEEHWYDALGRKVLTRARRDSLCTFTSNTGCASYIERTVWDGDQVLYELRGEGADNAAPAVLNADVSNGAYHYGKVGYVHAGGIDAPLVLMGGRVPTYNWRGLPESSVWPDGSSADCTLGAPSGCTTIRWPGNQGVYMNPRGSGSSLQGPSTWVGTLLANGVGSTGMAYRRNRFYDGATGQFNQQDPIGLAGGANTYGFAGGDPVNYSDPFGLMACPPMCGPSQRHLEIEAEYARNASTGERVLAGAILGAVTLGPSGLALAARIAAPATPMLASGRGHDMLRQAVGHLQGMASSQRVAAFRNFAQQIESATQGAWSAAEQQAVNATVFAGRAGEAIVFNAQGQAFRGNIGNAEQFTRTARGLVANYDKLNQIVK